VPNKVADRSQKLFRLIHERHVLTVGQDDELRAGDPFVHLLRHSWIALVVIAHDDLSGNPDLRKQLSQTRQVFREPFEVYANGRLQTIEGTDFSFGIGTRPGEQEASLNHARKGKQHGTSHRSGCEKLWGREALEE
jgi:hypothetical protein